MAFLIQCPILRCPTSSLDSQGYIIVLPCGAGVGTPNVRDFAMPGISRRAGPDLSGCQLRIRLHSENKCLKPKQCFSQPSWWTLCSWNWGTRREANDDLVTTRPGTTRCALPKALHQGVFLHPMGQRLRSPGRIGRRTRRHGRAIAGRRLEAIGTGSKTGWRPSPLGWRPLLLVARSY